MKVKIIKANLGTYWYADLIGHVFDVKLSKTGSDYELTNNNNLNAAYFSSEVDGHMIDINDAVVVDDNEQYEYTNGTEPDEETIEALKSISYGTLYGETRFDLEEQLTQCWSIIDQIDTVIDGVIEYDWTPDQISNALIGIKEIYDLKFDKLFAVQETLISTGKLK